MIFEQSYPRTCWTYFRQIFTVW